MKTERKQNSTQNRTSHQTHTRTTGQCNKSKYMTSRTPENKQDGNIHDKKETGRTEKDKQNGKSHKSQYKTKNMKKNTDTERTTTY